MEEPRLVFLHHRCPEMLPSVWSSEEPRNESGQSARTPKHGLYSDSQVPIQWSCAGPLQAVFEGVECISSGICRDHRDIK